MMLRNILCRSAAIMLILSLTGCGSLGRGSASQEVPEDLRSGFLTSYSRVQPVADQKTLWRWVNPKVDWSKYTRFIVDPVESRVPPKFQDKVQPNPDVIAAVTEYFREALIREIGSRYKVVDKPGRGVGRISVAVTSIIPTTKQLEAWQYLPIGLVAAGIGEAAGLREKNLVVYMENEITDSLNGKLLLEAIEGRVSEGSGIRDIQEVSSDTVRPVLDFWAADTVRLLEEAAAK